MSIFGLVGLIAAIALVTTFVVGLAIQRPEGSVGGWAIAYLRNFLGVFFIFSGVVKAIDPIGTSIKLGEYFSIFTEYIPLLTPLWDICASLALPIAIFTIVLEVALGISMILGTLPTVTLTFYLGLMLFFTALTYFSHTTGKVTDCGCFGDFVKLKPFESFLKDVFLTTLVLILMYFRRHIKPLFKSALGMSLLAGLTILTFVFNLRNYYDLPIVDFRAYSVGTNIPEGRSDQGLDPGEIQINYTLENANGESKVVSSEDYMEQKMWEDKSWTINKDKTTKDVIREAELPKVKDFYLFSADDQDVTDSLLNTGGYQFIVAAYDISKATPDCFRPINKTIKAATADGVTTFGVTASDLEIANGFTEGLYGFNTLDATPIKTMIRANPGILLLKDGIIVGKWHHNTVPDWASIKKDFGI